MTHPSMDTIPTPTVRPPDSDYNYFDLHTFGLGYVNRIRVVPPKQGRKGEAFLACTIAALNGPRNNAVYRYYDVRVSGKDAQHLIRRCMPACDAKKKILIGFCLGDEWTDTFVYPANHEKAGKTGVTEKARLLFVGWIKIDGELVYRAKDRAANDPDSPAAESTASSIDTPESVEGAAFAAA
jgi:hypothetical protein